MLTRAIEKLNKDKDKDKDDNTTKVPVYENLFRKLEAVKKGRQPNRFDDAYEYQVVDALKPKDKRSVLVGFESPKNKRVIDIQPKLKKTRAKKAVETKDQKKDPKKSKITKDKKVTNSKDKKDLRQSNIKSKVINEMMTEYPFSQFQFHTREECKSSSHTKPYYISKKDLVDIIENNVELKGLFPKGHKNLKKEDICDILMTSKENEIKSSISSFKSSSSSSISSIRSIRKIKSKNIRSSSSSNSSSSSSSSSNSKSKVKSKSKSRNSSNSSNNSNQTNIPAKKLKNESNHSSKDSSDSDSNDSTDTEDDTDDDKVINIGMLKYNNNSCYIDSFFMSIMHTPNIIADNLINADIPFDNDDELYKISTEIRKAIIDIQKHIEKKDGNEKKTYVCFNIRSLFEKFDLEYQKTVNKRHTLINWSDEMQEPSDIIELLHRAFKIENNTSVIQRSSTAVRPKVIQITFDCMIIDIQKEPVDALENIMNENVYIIKKTTGIYVKVSRAYQSEEQQEDQEWHDIPLIKSKQQLKVPPTIIDLNLKLVSIVVHIGNSIHNGHYVCYFLHNDVWYKFDDMVRNMQVVGTFSKLPRAVFNNCTGLVYVPVI